MSSNTPASFASAAAGQSRGSRPGEGDWPRRDGRSANGTLTFRRPSAAVVNQESQAAPDTSAPALPSLTESQAAQQSLPPYDGSMRYSRDQIVDIFKGTQPGLVDVNNLLVEGWNTTQINGAARSWGKSSDGTVPQDPTVCWDATGGVTPMALQEMTEDEKEAFVDVNSTLKPQQPKDSNQIGGGGGNTVSAPNGRKTSISHGTGFSNNSSNNNTSNTTTSISSPRPTTRRREASDTNSLPTGGLTSPLANRTPREESSWFGRKTADAKEPQQLVQQTEVPEEIPGPVAARVLNAGTLNRSNMAGSALGSGASALWGPSGSAPAPAAGTFGSFALPAATGDKRFGSARGESRLAHLIPKQDGADTTTTGTRTAGSGTSAIVTTPVGTATASGEDPKDSWRARPRTDTDPFGEDGGQSNFASQNPESADTPVKNARGDLGMSGLTIGSSLDEDFPGSPETNPFRSPPTDRNSGGLGSGDSAPMTGAVGASTGVDHAAIFGPGRGGYPSVNLDGSDRSQTSSVGAKGFSGLGNIAGWGNPLTSSTPDRDRAVFSTAFGSSLFSPGTGELQSPGFSGVGPSGGVFGAPGASGTGSLRTSTSKLGALFPASMQAQMSTSQDQEGNGLGDSIPDLRQINPLGAIGREAIGSQVRDADVAGIRPGRGLFDDSMDPTRVGPAGIFTTEQASQSAILASDSSPLPQHFESATRPNADTPLNAPRTMVMPDRMRWVYLDPQGQTQGPFTGLEMNDCTEFLRDDYNLQDRQMLSGILPSLNTAGNFPPQQSSGLAPDHGTLGHLPSIDQLQKDPQGFSERLKEFKQYREQFDATEAGNLAAELSLTTTFTHGKQQATAADVVDEVASERRLQGDNGTFAAVGEASESLVSLSLTQQVKKTQAEAAAAQLRETQAGDVAEALKPDLPMPFPPPPGALSSTPLAAPTAQRTRSTLPDQYATSQSRSETPEGGAHGTTQQPPLAPWARDPGSESHRGPSLKEIQEAEAKKAAKAEEIAAAARKVAAVQEAALQREREKAVAALTPGLPTSSTWGNGTPAVSVAAPTSPWAKASNAKPSIASAVTGGVAYSAVDKKKTLADIQREEEARKQKTRELSSQSPLASSPFVGKRYADLASRGQPPAVASPIATIASPVAATGWATVGAGGKVKTPTAAPSVRSASAAMAAAKPPVVPASARSSSKQLPGAPGKAEGGVAMDEFNKWLHREVSRGLADDIDVNMFVDTLLQLPLDQSIISEAVYGNSKTMDGRHFAEEFIRRKKLAERGVVEKQAPASTEEVKIGGGWSEVAKKGGNTGAPKEESMPAGFKVVSSRKKGKK
ncbi:hypothetical protein HMPREF1624_03945 [Sporothrix schenckii ATCC 58251]|uniref:GYF domain-containing protein n=1 Tax=Sporothrix schenckii (strain ATCC 58251 / de Perez 2211183) TaxID=1391915 RepID=U7Q1J8_SPOS1|nr:hypothetical protein HMPREF1624_03945 [Sporothrix schenckii ATCC 58251]